MEKYGFVKVAVAVPEVRVADVKFNCGEIIRSIQEADRQRAETVLFPELCITAYSCGDLFFSNTLLDGALQGLLRIARETAALEITAVVGLPLYKDGHLFNCAAVINRGRVLGIVPKTFLPSYGEFYEARWFYPATAALDGAFLLDGEQVPFGTDLLFECAEMRFAIEICEDAWVAMPPSAAHALAGANVIFNLSASNSVIGKKQYREMLVRSHSFTGHCAYVFSSAGVGESTTDTVYSGHVLVAENGSMLLNETAQEFESKIYYTELDLERLEADRKRLTTFHATAGLGKYLKIAFDGRRDCFEQLTRNVSDQPFVPRLASDRDRRLNEIFTILYLALAKRLHHTGLKHPVVGISGGLDSTLALLIIAKAMDQLGWDHSNIIAVTMPGFGTTGRTYQNAVKLMQLLGTTVKEINITDAVSQHFKDIGHDPENLDVTYENAQARERMQILMDIANQQNGLVIGTGDLSELALGWATYAGDHIAMYNVNSGVPKTLVRHLVRWIADHFEEEAVRKVLYDVLETPVSPELLPADAEGKIAQKTEEILGDYILHDFFIYYFLRFGFTGDKILFLAETAFAGTYSRAHIKETLLTFFERFFKHQFKRSCMPDGPKIGSVTLSPRADWRMPSDACAALWKEFDA